MQISISPELTQFARDVDAGLSSSPKYLSSKYFYDDEGSRLFVEIMQLPEYYLTAAETRIFSDQAGQILSELSPDGKGFDLIELGAGDGAKSAILIGHFLKSGADISYLPIDISLEACESLSARFRRIFPNLDVKPHHGDYFRVLDSLKSGSKRRKVIMFLGSNIGNLSPAGAVDFFRRLNSVMNEGDLLFIGFDLHKDPRVILRAYDDDQGITAKFNLNLLSRINRELGGGFEVEKFSHYAVYRPEEMAARSFLISREEQNVTIASLGRSFHFKKWEAVFMEISQKYTREMIAEFAAASGFVVRREFCDPADAYCDSLWEKRPYVANVNQ